MVEFEAVSSIHSFTDDVRFYKANDPYYWEVDNIPLKQLASNTGWLKDQITGGGKITGVNREDFNELLPYVNGNDRVVKVKPGRFSARINDAYNLTQLQSFLQVAGQDPASGDVFRNFAYNSQDVDLSGVLNKFLAATAGNATYMNGLTERAFTYPTNDSDFAAVDFLTTTPTTTASGKRKPPFPISEALVWVTGKAGEEYYDTATYDPSFQGANHMNLSRLETEFIRKWRGVSRIAIVDVPDELNITIPEFDITEYTYVNASGNTVQLPASQRVDLLFVYSKPVDASSTTIAKYENGTPRTITTPELGIVLGAGVNLNLEEVETSIDVNYEPITAIDSEGRSKMLPNISDELNTDNGFSGINVYGSFPAPDDLMNLAPLLSYKLESTSPVLVGQSILPIAYIVTESNNTVLNSDSIVDIRPFFRTAELAYNERAGIAAAMPQISMANPAVGKAQLDQEINRFASQFSSRLNALNSTEDKPRVVGGGYVFGGFNFGPEGTYRDFLNKHSNSTLTVAELNALVKKKVGLPTAFAVPDYPDWDTAKWLDQGSFSDKGFHVNDYINHFLRRNSNFDNFDYGSYDQNTLASLLTRMGTDNIDGGDSYVNVLFVKKTIAIDRTNVPWMNDYIVDCELLNCVPLSSRMSGFRTDEPAAPVGVWVEKGFNEFTIYVAWIANDPGQTNTATTERHIAPAPAQNVYPFNARDGHWFSGFLVVNQEIMNSVATKSAYTGMANAGVTTYPSVSFKITGIPQNFASFGQSVNGRRPQLSLN